MTRRLFPILGVAAGATAGLAYYWLWGCDSGCAMRESPVVTASLGALLGLVVSGGRR